MAQTCYIFLMSCLCFISISLLSLPSALAISENPSSASSTAHAPNRRRLNPDVSIINELNIQLANGIKNPRFTLTADFQDSGALFTEVKPLEINVVLANPSVSRSTTFSSDDASSFVGTHMKLLVADHANHENQNEFAILAVNEENGSVSGIVQKDGRLLKLEQLLDKQTVVTDVNYDPPKNWTCLVGSEHEKDRHRQYQSVPENHVHKLRRHVEKATESFGNRRADRRQLYPTDNFPNAWSYQVDLFLQVDDEFVQNHDTDTVNMPNTIDYVNALVTAVSSIFEFEVDTHLNVLHIEKTNIYDGAANASEALDIMQATYAQDTWHYTSPEGHNPDLHHFMAYRRAIVGIASVGGICDSNVGYGVTGGMIGTLSSIGGDMFWDLTNLAHELGHNFGSFHTHDGYTPLVDACGNNKQCTSLVTGEQVSSGSASIMSYCQTCPGGVANIASSFGGHWHADDRTNVDNWNNTESTVPFSQDPKRVPNVMYKNVATRGACVEPYLTPDIQTCSKDTDCHDGNSCTIDVCNGDQCSNTMQEFCCGNFICEAGESDCSDCGPFTLETRTCSLCSLPEGMMFDVVAKVDQTLTSIQFRLYNGTNSINLYTAPGGYADKYSNADAWTQIFSGNYDTSDWSYVSIDFSDIQLSAGSTQAFYIASTNKIATLKDNTDDPWAQDNNIMFLNSNRPVASVEFGNAYGDKLSWVGSITYTITAPTTSAPTDVPSKHPSSSPSRSPITSPSNSPTNSPSTFIPTSSPTAVPSTSPTIPPSASPSTSPSTEPPSTSPTNSPTISPIHSPSFSPSTSPSVSPISSSTPFEPPSINPTASPTNNPSSIPTKPPSTSPSSSPSRNPSTSPTMLPSNGPSTRPFLSPSTSPSSSPSISPSLLPIIAPSVTPSTNPTAPPTAGPGGSPSFPPSSIPSMGPSIWPSTSPTKSPSDSPFRSPSILPSHSPSTSPTSSPTRSPSFSPSRDHSSAPSESTTPSIPSPTLSPSRSPSGQPSRSPVSSSSTSPSHSPSSSPSTSPFDSPSNSPSSSPSHVLSSVPSDLPSLSPTVMAKNSTTVIQMVSVLEWNLTCVGLNNANLVNISHIIEQSVFIDMEPIMRPLNETIDLVYVYNLCNQAVANHTGTSPARRLQAETPSKIEMTITVASVCDECSERIFNDSNVALTQIVNDGNLTATIRKLSSGSIQAAVNPGVNSTLVTLPSTSPSISQRPSASPSLSASPSMSYQPSNNPSASFFPSLSISPSSAPITPPSTSPSPRPTASPSVSPLTKPSNAPSISPSVSPHNSPSAAPSTGPNTQPSTSPFKSPSTSSPVNLNPTPTASPTTMPTTPPSQSPSISPSLSPTSSPSISPFASPSLVPTLASAPAKAPLVTSQPMTTTPTIHPTTRLPTPAPTPGSSEEKTPMPASKTPKIPKDPKTPKEPKEPKETKEPKESKEPKDPKESKDVKQPKESKKSNNSKSEKLQITSSYTYEESSMFP